MSFIGLGFLWALPLIAIPLVMHFFRRQRREVTMWGAMQFLRDPSRHGSRMSNLDQWLLMAMRILAIACLVGAFAQPIVQFQGSSTEGPRPPQVILLDDTRSALTGDTFERIRKLALHAIAKVPSGTPIEVWALGTPVRRIGPPFIAGTSQQHQTEQRLREFAPRGGGADDFSANLRRVASSVHRESRPDDRAPETGKTTSVDLWMLTDTTNFGWPASTSPIRFLPNPNDRLHLITFDPHVTRGQVDFQLAVESLVSQRGKLTVGETTRVTATVANHGIGESPKVQGVWRIGSRVFSTVDVESLEPASQTTLSAEIPIEQAGTTAITFELPLSGNDDPLAADNQASAVVQAIGHQPVLVISNDAQWDQTPGEADFLAAALGHNFGVWNDGGSSEQQSKEANDPSQNRQKSGSWRSLYRPERVSADQLKDIRWERYRVFVVLGDTVLPALAWDKLAAAVRSGAGLWLTTGTDTDIETINRRLSKLGISVRGGTLLNEMVVHTDPEDVDRIHPPDQGDAVIGALADTERLDLDKVRIRRRWSMSLPDSQDQTRSLLRTFGGDPVAILASVGRGRVVLQSIPLDPSWSNFALQSSFVVWVSTLLDHLATPLADQHNLAIGQMIRSAVPWVEDRYEIQTPSGGSEEVAALSASTGDQSGGIVRYQDTDQPGLYTLKSLDRPADSLDPFRPVQFAISGTPRESMIHQSGISPMQSLATHERIDWNPSADFDVEAELRKIEPDRDQQESQPLWQWLIFGLFLAIALETFMAGYAALSRYGRLRIGTRGGSGELPSNPPTFEAPSAQQSARTAGATISAKTLSAILFVVVSGSSLWGSNLWADEGVLGSETTVTEQLNAEGWFGWTGGITLGVILIVLSTGWLVRQRELLGTGTTALIILLRLGAITAASWILIQPTWTRTETFRRKAEIIVMADSSASMDTIDGWETETVSAWGKALSDQDDDRRKVDRALFHLRIAGQQLANNEPETQTFDSVSQRIGRVTDHLGGVSGAIADSTQTITEQLDTAQSAIAEISRTRDRASQLAFRATTTESIESAIIELDSLSDSLPHFPQASVPSVVRSRREYVAELLDQMESQWAAHPDGAVEIRRAVFSDGVKSSTDPSSVSWTQRMEAPNPSADARTNLSDAISFAGLASSRRVAGMVILSEGQHNVNSVTSPIEAAASLPDIPVFTVTIGDIVRRRDVAIHRASAPAVVYLDDSPVIEVLLSAYQCANEQVDVTLSLDDEDLATQTVVFDSDQSDAAVRFDVPPQNIGRFEYTIRVDPLDGETNTQNNESFVAIEAVKSELYVLIADTQPRWETRYLEQLFRRDRRVKLDRVTLKPKVKSTVGTTAHPLPVDPDQWAKFDVVILGDLPPSVLTPDVQSAVADYVKSAGRLIVVAGRDSMPAAYVDQDWFNLLPVLDTPMPVSYENRPTPTADGLLTPVFRLHDTTSKSLDTWRAAMNGPFPGFVSPYHAAKPTANVLASLGELDTVDWGDPVPAWAAMHQVGRGKVFYLASPVSYRLRQRQGDRFHHQFWGQLIRLITASDLASGNRQVRIRTDRSQYDETMQPVVRVRLADDDGVPIRGGDLAVVCRLVSSIDDSESNPATTANHQKDQLVALEEDLRVPGTYQATLGAFPAGVYQVEIAGPTWDLMVDEQNHSDQSSSPAEPPSARFTVRSNRGVELLFTEANPVLMRQIAEASGGQAIAPTLLSEIPSAVSLAPEVSQSRQTHPLWNRWKYLWLLVGCLGTEWFLRRRRGLF